ncbi:DUF3853 family protein [Leadbetterella byssophila]|uniref:DUF3853 family protein n=1 Tax=Leadbetterella byssophila TaxID=316068 RepID=UPI0039A1499F
MIITKKTIKTLRTMTQITEIPPRVIYILEGDLESIVANAVEKAFNDNKAIMQKGGSSEKVYGISGIAKALGCSRSTAYKIKESGVLDGAISQVGKVIVGYEDKIIEAGAAYYKSLKQKKQQCIKQPRKIRI